MVVKRIESAQRTETAVLDAARTLFIRDGYGPTTIRQIAHLAGVSVETVYKRFGNKASLLKRVYDVTLAGDLEDKPMAARGLSDLEQQPDAHAMLDGYVRFALQFHGRVGPLISLAQRARAAEPDLDRFVFTVQAERRTGAGYFTKACSSKGFVRVDPGRAADELWLMTSFELIGEARALGWTDDQIVEWVVTSLRTTAFA